MSVTLRYEEGATRPDAEIVCSEYLDGVQTPIDLSTGYTLAVRVGRRGNTIFEETAPAVVGTTTGVTVDWSATGKLGDLLPGQYLTTVVATAVSDGERRIFDGKLSIGASLPAVE